MGDLEELEEDSEATLRWQDHEDHRTTEALARWAGADALLALLDSLPEARAISAPWHCGERWFSSADIDAEEGKTGRDFWPSPDGRWLVVALLHGPTEAGELRFVDAASGDVVGPTALYTTMTRVEWLPDSSGVYFNGVTFEGAEMRGGIYAWAPGGEAELQPVSSPTLDVYAKPSTDGRRVLISGGNHVLSPIAIIDRVTGNCAAVRFDDGVHVDGMIFDDRFIAITTFGADRGRVIAAPLDQIEDRSAWSELVSESAAALRALSVVGRRLVLSELVDGCGQLRVVEPDTGEQWVLPVPVRGAITPSGLAAPIVGTPMCRVSGAHDEITFLASGPATPLTGYGYDLAARELHPLDDKAASLHVLTETIAATSADGTPVPCVIVHRSNLDRTRPQPTLVLAYGGFNLPNTPRFQPAAAAFILSGGVVAYPMLRGGGEFGKAWWEDGKRRSKQNTFDDLYAVCESLIARGATTAALLALQGGSNGGLTAATAAAQRPDLFRVVVATAPLTDLLRHHLAAKSDVTTAVTIAEFGDPDDPDDAASIRTWSPCDNVTPASPAPAVLVAAAENDVRTPPWHARKFVARLQAVRPDATARLRIWRNYGHGIGGGNQNQRTAEWLGFVMYELGMAPALVERRVRRPQ